MEQMKDLAIICNIGHFDCEIDIDAIQSCQWDEIKPQVDQVTFEDGKRLSYFSQRSFGQFRLRYRSS